MASVRDGFVYIALESTLIGLSTAGCKELWALPHWSLRDTIIDAAMGVVVGFVGGCVRYLYRRVRG